jgi:hypothetical protein
MHIVRREDLERNRKGRNGKYTKIDERDSIVWRDRVETGLVEMVDKEIVDSMKEEVSRNERGWEEGGKDRPSILEEIMRVKKLIEDAKKKRLEDIMRVRKLIEDAKKKRKD